MCAEADSPLEVQFKASWRGRKRGLEFAKWQSESVEHKVPEVDLGGKVLGTVEWTAVIICKLLLVLYDSWFLENYQ